MERFQLWLDRYADAWRHGDPEAVDDLFAPGARYQESPFAEPIEGVEAIRAYWARGVAHSRADVVYEAQALAVGEEAGVAHWRAEFTSEPAEHRVVLDGVLAATVGGDGRCTSFREWWHRLEDHG
jgi:hypothetical protein